MIHLDTVAKNLDNHIKLIQSVIKSAEDVLLIVIKILGYADGWALTYIINCLL